VACSVAIPAFELTNPVFMPPDAFAWPNGRDGGADGRDRVRVSALSCCSGADAPALPPVAWVAAFTDGADLSLMMSFEIADPPAPDVPTPL
jgi:hypothetical protein